jgi:hypothetical protein
MKQPAARSPQHAAWHWAGGALLGACVALLAVWLVPSATVHAPPLTTSSAPSSSLVLPAWILPSAGASSSAAPADSTAPTPSTAQTLQPVPTTPVAQATDLQRRSTDHSSGASSRRDPAQGIVWIGTEPRTSFSETQQRAAAPEPAPSPATASAAPEPEPEELPKAVRAAGVTYCGAVACSVGSKCCCDHCVPYTDRCASECEGTSSLSLSVPCGMQLCSSGQVCCNPSCGICAAPGKSCSQKVCE